jgi:2-polyprenyl-3-methyl-5-hydroxy-6-metoxy-1,4-benzoquinol methylase
MNCDVREFVKKELLVFTGLSEKTLNKYLTRSLYPTFKKEWEFWKPKTPENIRFFYMASRGYLFGNATHILHKPIYDDINKEHIVFDFGGGTGNFSFPLCMKGCKVLYYDINFLQKEFVKFVAKRNNFDLTVLDHNDLFLPQITTPVDRVITLDVLEHIPGYNKYIEHISNSMNNNAKIYIRAPFGTNDPTHLKDKHGLNNVMKNCGFTKTKDLKFNNKPISEVYIKNDS